MSIEIERKVRLTCDMCHQDHLIWQGSCHINYPNLDLVHPCFVTGRVSTKTLTDVQRQRLADSGVGVEFSPPVSLEGF